MDVIRRDLPDISLSYMLRRHSFWVRPSRNARKLPKRGFASLPISGRSRPARPLRAQFATPGSTLVYG